jgi:tRNA(fMet)-specific endonuclease VapC
LDILLNIGISAASSDPGSQILPSMRPWNISNESTPKIGTCRMLQVAIDTNAYSDLHRGDQAVAEALSGAKQLFLPFVVLAELRAGFRHGRRGEENERLLQEFVAEPGVSVLYPNEETTHAYAALHRQLRAQGTPIPVNDLWIAALVVQHGLTLHSRDAHFDHFPQIPRV